MKKWILTMSLVIVVIMTIPELSEAKNNGAKSVSGPPDPGYLDFKDPSVALLDGITVIAYVRDMNVQAQGDNYRLILKVSNSYDTANFAANQGLYISSGYERNQRRPDVTLVKYCKSFNPLVEEIVAFVTWQEYNEDTRMWEVWVSNATIDPTQGTGTISQNIYQNPVKISRNTGVRWDAINPRINGSYLPPFSLGGGYYASGTAVMVVYQQEHATENNYVIYESHTVYDYNDRLTGSPTVTIWPTNNIVDEMGPDDECNFQNPSIDTYMYQEYGTSEMAFSIVCDAEDGQIHGRCSVGDLSFPHNADTPNNISYIQYEDNNPYLFNVNSQSLGYPDTCVRMDEGTLIYIVVWQSDTNFALAKHIFYPTVVTLGACKSPSFRGVSIDDSPIQYQYMGNDNQGTVDVRQSWINPGGFEVVWMSGDDKPSGGTYGIDSRNIEFKNNILRLTHNYASGYDDAYSGGYSAKSTYRETSDSSDEYVTIATDNSGQGMVTWLRSDSEIYTFKWLSYTD